MVGVSWGWVQRSSGRKGNDQAASSSPGAPLPAHCATAPVHVFADGSVVDCPPGSGGPPDRFGPGHLGELTRLLPPELVDAALAETRTTQRRLRRLPSRVVVYLVLAGCLFPEVGYTGVWSKLTMALGGEPTAPTAGALSQARRRIGPAPLRWLFDLLRGPVGADPHREGVWWKDQLVCAIDGTIVTVADTDQVKTRYVKQAGNHGGTGYPQIRVLALTACGTRAIIDAVHAPTTIGETTLAPNLARSLHRGMLVLADRNFDARDVLAAITATGADFLIRAKTIRRLPVVERHTDGSFTSRIDHMSVRVIDATMTITTDDGRQQTRAYRILTSLTNPGTHPAADLARLYHERWEIETSFYELKSSILGGRVLRARTPAGIEQELYALHVTYQLLRTVISDATSTTGADPDRGSFTTALHATRDHLIATCGTSNPANLIGPIGTRILNALLPPRRLRVCPRIVKRAISKYQARGPVIDRTCRKAHLKIDVHTSEPP